MYGVSLKLVSVPIRGLFNLTLTIIIILVLTIVYCFRPHQGII